MGGPARDLLARVAPTGGRGAGLLRSRNPAGSLGRPARDRPRPRCTGSPHLRGSPRLERDTTSSQVVPSMAVGRAVLVSLVIDSASSAARRRVPGAGAVPPLRATLRRRVREKRAADRSGSAARAESRSPLHAQGGPRASAAGAAVSAGRSEKHPAEERRAHDRGSR